MEKSITYKHKHLISMPMYLLITHKLKEKEEKADWLREENWIFLSTAKYSEI